MATIRERLEILFEVIAQEIEEIADTAQRLAANGPSLAAYYHPDGSEIRIMIDGLIARDVQ